MNPLNSMKKLETLTKRSAEVTAQLCNIEREDAQEIYERLQEQEAATVKESGAFAQACSRAAEQFEKTADAKRNLRVAIAASVDLASVLDIPGIETLAVFDRGDDLAMCSRLEVSLKEAPKTLAPLSGLLGKLREDFLRHRAALNASAAVRVAAERSLTSESFKHEALITEARALLVTLGVSIFKRKPAPRRSYPKVQRINLVATTEQAPVIN